MNSVGKHIINKVFVDVYANSTENAYKLKDNIDTFLVENVFPYLEKYFQSLENGLPSDIVQIPKLALEINTGSQNNFIELKEEIKNQVARELEKVMTTPLFKNQEVNFLNYEESKLRSFFFFLEEGISPWWDTANNKMIFDKKEISELVKADNFQGIISSKNR